MIRAGQRGGTARRVIVVAGVLGLTALARMLGAETRANVGTTGQPTNSTALAEVRAMMTGSAAAWNRGDLDAFVRDYAPGEGTTYIGRRGIVRGMAAIRAVYAPRFVPGFRRGTLRFEELEVDRLGPDVVNAIAYYVLSERTAAGTDSVIARGPTSLVMRKLGGAWKIVHDHSS